MATTNETTTPATTTPGTGIRGLRCPLCQELDQVHVNLAEPTDFYCGQCGDSFARGAVEDVLAEAAKWQAALAWIDSIPSND